MSFDFARESVRYADYGDRDSVSLDLSADPKDEIVPRRRQPVPTKRLVVVRPQRSRAGWVQTAEEVDVHATVQSLIQQMRLKYLQLSNLERLVFSEEYMAVIGIGPRVVPILLADMKTGIIPWFWALKAITRQNVGSEVASGDFAALRKAWLEWGKKSGLV